jgi:putative membrane protein
LESELVTKTFHYLGFLGCLVASFLKNKQLRSTVIEGAALTRLLALDRISGASALIILASGLILTMWAAKPTAVYTSDPSYWTKVGLYVVASIAVVLTKPMIRNAAKDGRLEPKPLIRLLLLFDLISILTVAAIGRMVAHGSIF